MMNSTREGASLRDSRIIEFATGALWLYPFIDPHGMEISVNNEVVTIASTTSTTIRSTEPWRSSATSPVFAKCGMAPPRRK